MCSLSIWHWIIVIAVVLLLFGRGKISELMGDVAQGIKAFKKGMSEDETAKVETPPADPKTINQVDAKGDPLKQHSQTDTQYQKAACSDHAYGNPAAHRGSRVSAIQFDYQLSRVQPPCVNILLNFFTHRYPGFACFLLNTSQRFTLRRAKACLHASDDIFCASFYVCEDLLQHDFIHRDQ